MSALQLTKEQHISLRAQSQYIDLVGELKAFFKGAAAVSPTARPLLKRYE
jgi:hypothetical protein